MCMSGPSISTPPPPAPPPAPPTAASPDVLNGSAAARQKALAAGAAQTNLTGPAGVALASNTGGKTLLGG